MQRIAIYLTVLLLFGVGSFLAAQVPVPFEDMAKGQGLGNSPGSEFRVDQRPGGDEPGTVQAPLEQMHGITAGRLSPAVSEPPVLRYGKGSGNSPASYQWGEDVLVTDPSEGMIKPGIAYTPDGVLYAVVEEQVGNDITVYHSTDDGETWSELFWFGAGDDLRNPSVAYGEGASDQALHMVAEVVSGTQHGVIALHLELPSLIVTYHYVDWSFNMLGTDQVYPRVCTDSIYYTDYFVYVTYSKWAADHYPVMFARSMTKGLSFEAPENITGGAENSSWATRPDIAFGSPGLFVTFEKLGWSGSAWVTQPWITESNNYGTTFSQSLQLSGSNYPGYHPAVAAARGSDSVLVAYTKEYSVDTDVACAYSLDGGINWMTNYTLPWSADNEKSVDLCASDYNGRFHAAYHQDNYSIRYTFTDYGTPNTWDTGEIVNQNECASSSFSKPSICVNPTLPLADEACVTWTDFRNTYYGVYFDNATVPPLTADKSFLSAGSGGVVNFSLQAGLDNDFRTYLIIGTLSGTSPGLPLPGGLVTLPINWDSFTDYVMARLNQPTFDNFLSNLNAAGEGTAQLNFGPLASKHVGKVMSFAYVLQGNPDWDFVSNPVSVEVIP